MWNMVYIASGKASFEWRSALSQTMNGIGRLDTKRRMLESGNAVGNHPTRQCVGRSLSDTLLTSLVPGTRSPVLHGF